MVLVVFFSFFIRFRVYLINDLYRKYRVHEVLYNEKYDNNLIDAFVLLVSYPIFGWRIFQ